MSDAAEQRRALTDVLQFPQADSLGATFDQLRLVGAVAAQVALLDVAVNGAKAADRVAAAKALSKLGEKPEDIAERLKASIFADLDTRQLVRVVALIKDGWAPRSAVQEVLRTEEAS